LHHKGFSSFFFFFYHIFIFWETVDHLESAVQYLFISKTWEVTMSRVTIR
jgi:hypothetical protein